MCFRIKCFCFFERTKYVDTVSADRILSFVEEVYYFPKYIKNCILYFHCDQFDFIYNVIRFFFQIKEKYDVEKYIK